MWEEPHSNVRAPTTKQLKRVVKKKKLQANERQTIPRDQKHVVGISIFGLSKSLPFEALLTENSTAELPPGYPLCVYGGWVFLSLLTPHLQRICHLREGVGGNITQILYAVVPQRLEVLCIHSWVSSMQTAVYQKSYLIAENVLWILPNITSIFNFTNF